MCNDGTVEYGRLQCCRGEYNKQPYAYPHLLSLVYRVFGVRPRRGRSPSTPARWRDRLRASTCSHGSLFADRVGGGLRGAAAGAHAAAAAVVGDGRRRAVGVAGVRRWRSSRRCRPCAFRAVAALLGAGGDDGVCGAVPPRVAADPAGRGACCSWRHRARRVGAGALGWWALLAFAAPGRPRGAPVRRAQRGLGNERRAPVAAATLPAQPPCQRPRSTSATSDFRSSTRCWRSSGWRGAAGSPSARRWSLYFLAVLRHRPAVLRRQLQLRRRRPLLADDLSAAGGARPASALRGGRRAGYGRRRRRAGRRGRSAAAWLFSSSGTRRSSARRPKRPGRRGPMCEFAALVAAELPANSYVLTHNPGMFHVWGVNAGQMSLAADNPGYLRLPGRTLPGRRLPALELLVQRPGACTAGPLPAGSGRSPSRNRADLPRTRLRFCVLQNRDPRVVRRGLALTCAAFNGISGAENWRELRLSRRDGTGEGVPVRLSAFGS